MERNTNVYAQAIKMALKVEFLANREEFLLYARTLCDAMMWSMGVDEKNRAIREKNKSVK